jgi:hypothetical protein
VEPTAALQVLMTDMLSGLGAAALGLDEGRSGFDGSGMTFRFTSAALTELRVAALDYESKQAGLGARFLTFFMRLTGAPCIPFFVMSLAFLVLGGGSIACAKFPAYRVDRFFSFGLKTIPEHLQGHYRWGWRAFWFGVILGLCLPQMERSA